MFEGIGVKIEQAFTERQNRVAFATKSSMALGDNRHLSQSSVFHN